MIEVEKLLKKTKPEMVQIMVDEIAAVDDRRQRQIRNQVGTINRLMAGHTYESEMERLHTELAETQSRLEAALLEIRRMNGETTSAYNLGVSKEV